MFKNTILIADDEPLTRESLYEILRLEGYEVFQASNGNDAFELVKRELPEIVITDLKMPKMGGIDLLKNIKQMNPDTAVILVTGFGSIENAVEAMKQGAFEYVTKPIIDSEIKIIVKRILEQKKILNENKFLRQRLALSSRNKFHKIIGQNFKMQKIFSLIESVAPTTATVLIQGQSGTGKRLIAQAIHNSDTSRKDKPFVEVSCGALPENLLESELFGHIKGSFTSAIKDRKGRFESADGGTIFLDEIDAFSPKLQVKLLKVLQEGDFERVGDSKTIKVNIRIVAATNQDLKKLIKEKMFREDLYYRLNVIPVYAPPLCERKDDISLLTEHFVEKYSRKNNGKHVIRVSTEVEEALMSYHWPGNVRELENVIERAVILSKSEVIEKKDLPDFLQEIKVSSFSNKNGNSKTLKSVLKLSEKEIIEGTLRDANGNRKKAAQVLGINRTTLYNKMREHNIIDVPD